MIIAINGRIGSGKDTVGAMIQDLANPDRKKDRSDVDVNGVLTNRWQIKKFAAKLKYIASLLTGIPVEKFEDQEFKKTYLDPNLWQYVKTTIPSKSGDGIMDLETVNYTVREFLQKLGTEAVRDNIHPNTWVNALFVDYKPQKVCKPMKYRDQLVDCHDEIPNWIITDCRFPNEADAVKKHGGVVIRITRPGENKGDLHPSETSLDNYQFDYVIENDGSLDQLEVKVEDFLKQFKIIQ